jgi:hypothetical protein
MQGWKLIELLYDHVIISAMIEHLTHTGPRRWIDWVELLRLPSLVQSLVKLAERQEKADVSVVGEGVVSVYLAVFPLDKWEYAWLRRS